MRRSALKNSRIKWNKMKLKKYYLHSCVELLMRMRLAVHKSFSNNTKPNGGDSKKKTTNHNVIAWNVEDERENRQGKRT